MKTFSEWLNNEKEFPKIHGNVWNDLKLRPIGSSMNSISSTLNSWEPLDGIREVSYSGWNMDNFFYDPKDWDRARSLAEDISSNKEIEPLILAIDSEDEPYIIEGHHRCVALYLLKYKSFPAYIVIDTN